MSHHLIIVQSANRDPRDKPEREKSKRREQEGAENTTPQAYSQIIVSGYYKLHAESFIIKQTHKASIRGWDLTEMDWTPTLIRFPQFALRSVQLEHKTGIMDQEKMNRFWRSLSE